MAVFSPIFTITTTSLSLSLLPRTLPCRVRTHIRDYVRNDVYLNNLQANYFADLGNGFYGQVYGGYLETMYAVSVPSCFIAR